MKYFIVQNIARVAPSGWGNKIFILTFIIIKITQNSQMKIIFMIE